jgi:hypothetical protein
MMRDEPNIATDGIDISMVGVHPRVLCVRLLCVYAIHVCVCVCVCVSCVVCGSVCVLLLARESECFRTLECVRVRACSGLALHGHRHACACDADENSMSALLFSSLA